MSTEAEDLFLEEVLGLFALEAQEWVAQANQALNELEAGCSPDRCIKLYDTVIRGISNLAGSAGTVDLTEVEQLARALLPVLQRLREHVGSPPAEPLASIRAGLTHILTAVQAVRGFPAGANIDVQPLVSELRAAASEPARAVPVTSSASGSDQPSDERDGAMPDEAPVTVPPPLPAPTRSDHLREALLQLLEAQEQSPEGTRHSADVVLRKAGGDSDELDDREILKALREIELLDEQFLTEVRKRAPLIVQSYETVRGGGAGQGTGRERIVQDIEHLYEISRFVNSTPIMLYLQGLRTFLRIARTRPALIPDPRYDAVGGRVAMLEALAQRWVDVGRAERASIEKILQS